MRLLTLGERQAAISNLELALRERARQLVWVNVDPRFALLRKEPAFLTLAENRSRENQKLGQAVADIERAQKLLEELAATAQVSDWSLIPEAVTAHCGRVELTNLIKGHRAALVDSCGILMFNAQHRPVGLRPVAGGLADPLWPLGNIEARKRLEGRLPDICFKVLG